MILEKLKHVGITENNKMIKKILPYILLIIVSALCLHLYNDRNIEVEKNIENTKAYNAKIKYFENEKGEIVASKLAIQLTNKELNQQVKGSTNENKRLREAIKKYKKVIATIQTTQSVKIDTIYQKFTDTIKEVFSKDIVVSDNWYRLNQNITNKGFKITNLELFNKQDVVIGWKKQGLFKKPLATVDVTNSNPYFKQEKIKPIIIVYNRKWYEKAFITIPLGILVGLVID